MRLSLVIPAYNEAERLPAYLLGIREHFARAQFGYEVIVVDDGSTDGLATLLADLARTWKELRLVRHPQNQGRGAAIRTGSRAARGELVMYADADGATPIGEEAKLRAAMDAGADIAIGSRSIRGCAGARYAMRIQNVAARGCRRSVVPVRGQSLAARHRTAWRGAPGRLPHCRGAGSLVGESRLEGATGARQLAHVLGALAHRPRAWQPQARRKPNGRVRGHRGVFLMKVRWLLRPLENGCRI